MKTTERKIFRDRKDAGIRLGEMLSMDYSQQDVLILGIPRGGIEIAYYVAEKLNKPYSVVVSKKLGMPGQEELAFGAIAEDGSIYLSPLGKAKVNPEVIDRVVQQKEIEIKRRIDVYRNGNPLPPLEGKVVIIVDDGIATGSTIVPIIDMCRKKGAKKIVVAAPVSPSTTLEILDKADELKILEQPYPFYAVGQFYQSFNNLEDDDVLRFLR